MIDRDHKLSVSRQTKALGISRGSVYYLPQPVSDADLKLMRRIDELHLEFSFAGSRMLRELLRQESHDVGQLHVATLMKRMGIAAIYRRPNTSKPAPWHKVYPYLLRNVPMVQPNQVWAMDITYIPMSRGVRHWSRTDGDQCLTIPGRRSRLVQPQGPGLEAVDHAVRGLLH